SDASRHADRNAHAANRAPAGLRISATDAHARCTWDYRRNDLHRITDVFSPDQKADSAESLDGGRIVRGRQHVAGVIDRAQIDGAHTRVAVPRTSHPRGGLLSVGPIPSDQLCFTTLIKTAMIRECGLHQRRRMKK